MTMKIEDYLFDNDNAYYYDNNGKKCFQSVHGRTYTRYNEAIEQTKKDKVDKNVIINYVKEFLSANNISTAENPEFDPNKIDCLAIMNEYNLKDKGDIVWMKFTQDGFLGVVASGNDINFDIPPSAEEYDKKINYLGGHREQKERWKWNSSGILIHKLDKKWDESFVLVFPLSNIPNDYERTVIEKAVGNYLLINNVPILDCFSHMY